MQRRRMWACSPLLRSRRHVRGALDLGHACRDWTPAIVRTVETLPPLEVVVWNRIRTALVWLVFAVGMLARGKFPVGPGSHTYALPSRGLLGVWSRPSPMAFRGGWHRHVTCLTPSGDPDPVIRLLAKATCAPRPTAYVKVAVSTNGWVARHRSAAEVYPVGAVAAP